MSPGYEPGLASERLHFDVKDHVTPHKLMIFGNESPIIKYPECDLHIPHLLRNGVGPEGIAILLVQSQCSSDRFGYFHTKFKVTL